MDTHYIFDALSSTKSGADPESLYRILRLIANAKGSALGSNTGKFLRDAGTALAFAAATVRQEEGERQSHATEIGGLVDALRAIAKCYRLRGATEALIISAGVKAVHGWEMPFVGIHITDPELLSTLPYGQLPEIDADGFVLALRDYESVNLTNYALVRWSDGLGRAEETNGGNAIILRAGNERKFNER